MRPALAAAGLGTAAPGFAWHGLAAQAGPRPVLHGEPDVPLGLRPAAEVSVLGLLAAASVELRRPSLTRHAGRPRCGVLLHAAAGAVGALGATAPGLGDAICPDRLASVSVAAACIGIPALPGALRRNLPGRGWMPASGPASGKGPDHG